MIMTLAFSILIIMIAVSSVALSILIIMLEITLYEARYSKI